MPQLKVDHLLLASTESKLFRFVVQIVRKHNLLLLRKQQKQKYFNDCDFADKVIFMLSMQAKQSEPGSKPKQRIIGEIRVTSPCYNLDWDVVGLPRQEQNMKNQFPYFCEVVWAKKLQSSKSKLPNYFNDVFGRKEGYHLLKPLEGYKLKDILQYPTAMQQKVFADMHDVEYLISQAESDSDSDSSQSQSDSDDSSDDSGQSQKSRKKKKKNKSRERSRDKKKSDKDRRRSTSRGDKKKKSQHKKKSKQDKRNRSKDRKRDKSKNRTKKEDKNKKDKSKKEKDNDKHRSKDREKQKQRQKQKQREKQKNKDKDKYKEKQKQKQKQKDKDKGEKYKSQDKDKDKDKNKTSSNNTSKPKYKQKQVEKQVPTKVSDGQKPEKLKQEISLQQQKPEVRQQPIGQAMLPVTKQPEKRSKPNEGEEQSQRQPKQESKVEQLNVEQPKKKKGLFERLGAEESKPANQQ